MFVAALFERDRIGADRRWGVLFPGVGLLAMAGVFIGGRERRDGIPFAMAVGGVITYMANGRQKVAVATGFI